MKKSLIAIAAMAVVGAASAQSTVTLYGIADIWFGSQKTEVGATPTNAASSLSQTVLESGGVNGSRWGMKGSEDLGGGLKANFDLQAGFALDTGAGSSTSATAFSRQSWVGVSGGFGAVRVGRTTTPFDDVSGSSNGVFDSALAATNAVFKSNGYSGRQSNMFYYQAPSMGGFSGALSYALGEDKANAATAPVAPSTTGRTTDATSTTSVNLTYGAGPVAVQFAYQVEDTNVISAVGVTLADKKFTRLGGSYDFGVAKAKLSYGKAENMSGVDGADATDWQVGVDFPVSSALTVSANIASSSDNAKAGDNERDGFGVGASYSLSKRTFLYGGYRQSKEDFKLAATGDTKVSVLAVGLQHRF